MRFHHWRHLHQKKLLIAVSCMYFKKPWWKHFVTIDMTQRIPFRWYNTSLKIEKKATLTTHAVFLRFLKKFVKCLLCFAAFSCLLSRYAKCPCRWFCQKVKLRSHGRFVGAIYWNAMFCTMFCTLNPTDEEKGDPIISLVINNTFCNAK